MVKGLTDAYYQRLMESLIQESLKLKSKIRSNYPDLTHYILKLRKAFSESYGVYGVNRPVVTHIEKEIQLVNLLLNKMSSIEKQITEIQEAILTDR